MNKQSAEIFDQNYLNRQYDTGSADMARTVLELGGLAMKFAHVERAPHHSDGRRENDAEHSFNLGLVAPELAVALYPYLDAGLIAQFSMVHDLIELEVGDVATFNISERALGVKETQEHTQLDRLLSKLPPYLRSLVERYEAQEETEAVFTRCVDKLLPAAQDINGDGVRVMLEDYGIRSLADLQRCQGEVRERIVKRFGRFPELILIKDVLDQQFELKWLTESSVQIPEYQD